MSLLEQQYKRLGKYLELNILNEKQNKYDSSTKALLKKVKATKKSMDGEEETRVTLSRVIKFMMKKYQDYGAEAAKTYKEFTGKEAKELLGLRKKHAAFKKKQAEIMSKVKAKRIELKSSINRITKDKEKMRKLKDNVRINKKLITKAARIAASKGRL